MASKNPKKNKYVTDAMDYNDLVGWIDKPVDYEMPPDEAIVGYGRSITPAAFRKMISNKLMQLTREYYASGKDSDELIEFLKQKKCSIDFGKDSILRILSQQECIGLRLTFCINDADQESIIISGIAEEDSGTTDGHGKPIKRPCFIRKTAYQIGTDPEILPLDEEKGVGLTYGGFVEEAGVNIEELLEGKEKPELTKFTNKVFGLE